MITDAVNASFEVVGSIAYLLNIRQIMIDKEVKGVSVWPAIFFTTWSLWNTVWYFTLDKPLSLLAAIGMVTVNLWWLILYRKYHNDE